MVCIQAGRQVGCRSKRIRREGSRTRCVNVNSRIHTQSVCGPPTGPVRQCSPITAAPERGFPLLGDCGARDGILEFENEAPLSRFGPLVITESILEEAVTAAAGDHPYSVPIAVFGLLISQPAMVLFEPILSLVCPLDNHVRSPVEVHIVQVKELLEKLVVVDVVMET